MAIISLPLYPSTSARKSLLPSQLASLNSTIAGALHQVLELPPTKRDIPSTKDFIASYAKDAAQQALQALIWPTTEGRPRSEQLIRSRVLQLAEKLAASSSVGFSLEALVDLSVAYSPTNLSRVRAIWTSVLSSSPALLSSIASDAVPFLTTILSPARRQTTGLYGVRKAAHIVACLLHSLPPPALRLFAQAKQFVLTLAQAYGAGLGALANSYGGLQHHAAPTSSAAGAEPDEWERTWVECKVALLDSFHVLLGALLDDVAQASPGTALAAACDRAFDVVFELLEIESASQQPGATTPFHDRPLLVDYQQAYDLAKTLKAALRKADDARMDVLEATLQSFSLGGEQGGDPKANPGALRILLRSSGIAPGVDRKGKGRAVQPAPQTAPESAITSSGVTPADPDIDLKVAEVLSILPDHSTTYVRALLLHPDYPFRGDPHKVIDALLEGRAPSPEEMERSGAALPRISPLPTVAPQSDAWEYTRERRNVFDDEALDVANVRFGKKTYVFSFPTRSSARSILSTAPATIPVRLYGTDHSARRRRQTFSGVRRRQWRTRTTSPSTSGSMSSAPAWASTTLTEKTKARDVIWRSRTSSTLAALCASVGTGVARVETRKLARTRRGGPGPGEKARRRRRTQR